MQFKVYDILSRLIPGVFLLSVIALFSVRLWINNSNALKTITILKDFNAIIAIGILVFAYMVGYVLDGIGSWTKHWFWKFWGGRPSNILYKKDFKEIPFPEKKKKYQYLLEKCDIDRCKEKGLDNLSDEEFSGLYQFAKNMGKLKANEHQLHRMEQFGEAFAFSRNIFWTTFLGFFFCAIIQIFQIGNFIGWIFLLCLVGLSIVCYWRAKDKALFHAREVLSVAYYVLLEEEKSK